MPLTKTQFRKKCINKLRSSSSHNKIYRNKKVNQKLLKELHSSYGQNILFYYPLEMEANILDSLKKLRKKNKLFIPFMVEESFKMVPFRLPLKKKKFGIYEAGNTLKNIKNIDIAIVPVIGIDGNLQRVGFGKGMYDRFFARLKKKPYTIFVQTELCYTKELVCDDYDVSCDLLLTPRKVIKTSKINKGR